MSDRPEIACLLPTTAPAAVALSDLERAVVNDDSTGLYYKEIAQKRKLRTKSVDNALWRAKRNLRG